MCGAIALHVVSTSGNSGMFNLILFNPQIPANTGNIIRLCANAGCKLHLIEPLGFVLDDKRLRRAGLDYHEYAELQIYANLDACITQNDLKKDRIFAVSTKGEKNYTAFTYQKEDAFLFGSETSGLPPNIRMQFTNLKVPMCANSRSLNLSNCAAIITYEAWRQIDFAFI